MCATLCSTLVTESNTPSQGGLGESAGGEEFFDALASIRSSVSSFVASTAASLRVPPAGADESFASARSAYLGSARSSSSAVPPDLQG